MSISIEMQKRSSYEGATVVIDWSAGTSVYASIPGCIAKSSTFSWRSFRAFHDMDEKVLHKVVENAIAVNH